MKRIFLVLLALALGSCAAIPTVTPTIKDGVKPSTVLVFREHAFNSGGGNLYFGESGEYYLTLRNNEYGEVLLKPGQHTLIVTARASQDYPLAVNIEPGSKTCLKAYANPANYAKVLIPILMNLTSIFKVEVVACPSTELLNDYTRVPKTGSS